MEESNRPGGRRIGDWSAIGLGVLGGIVVLSLLVAAYALGMRRGEDNRTVTVTVTSASPPVTSTSPPASTESGTAAALALFHSTCGGCHTLAAAGTSGTVGPNLDDLKPTAAQVLSAIERGGLGTGQMPAGLLSGQDANAVAKAVSAAAGR